MLLARTLSENDEPPLPPSAWPAGKGDVPRIARILTARAPVTLPVPAEEITRRLREYRIIRRGDEAIATYCLASLDRQTYVLGSVAVAPGCRGQGLGRAIIESAQREAARDGRDLLCATVNPEFFERHGFGRASLATLPPRPERAQHPAPGRRVAMRWSHENCKLETWSDYHEHRISA